ncbi:hypothetical protein KRR40_23975 [Niabella defluvii]|nr:hypothetical protein KRR40_23975 [Niabella sp. I65]
MFTSDITYFLHRQTVLGSKYSLFSTSSTSYRNITRNIKVSFMMFFIKQPAHPGRRKPVKSLVV